MPLSKFTPEELTQLKATFEQLPTIKDKFDFWRIQLDYDYSLVGVRVALDQVQSFLIKPTTSDEMVELNLLVLQAFKFRHKPFKLNRDVLFEFEKEKVELDRKIRKAKNYLPLLIKEKEWVKYQVTKYEAPNNMGENLHSIEDWIWKEQIRKFWLAGYEDFYIWGKEPDLTNSTYSAPNLLAWNSGYEIAEYLEYVEKRMEELSQKRTPISREETPIKQQLLILHYTGYIKQIEENVKTDKERNKLIALLLNRSEQNIKKILTYISHPANLYDIKTKENLTFVLESLEKAGFKEAAQKVKIELDTLK